MATYEIPLSVTLHGRTQVIIWKVTTRTEDSQRISRCALEMARESHLYETVELFLQSPLDGELSKRAMATSLEDIAAVKEQIGHRCDGPITPFVLIARATRYAALNPTKERAAAEALTELLQDYELIPRDSSEVLASSIEGS